MNYQNSGFTAFNLISSSNFFGLRGSHQKVLDLTCKNLSKPICNGDHLHESNQSDYRRLRFFIALISFFLFIPSQLWSQANLVNYTYSTNNNGSLAIDMNANAVDMTSGTTTLLEGGRTAASSPVVNIGFDFYFMGTKMNQLGVNQAGIVQLGFNVPAPTNFYGATVNTLSPFGVSSAGGLNTGMGPASNGKIHSKVIGSFPNRCFVLEFENLP